MYYEAGLFMMIIIISWLPVRFFVLVVHAQSAHNYLCALVKATVHALLGNIIYTIIAVCIIL